MDLNNIVGFKAVDKNGNERQVTVDEMTKIVYARIVSAASETSTFAAAAAAGTDEFEDQLPVSDTFSWLRTLDGSKNPTLTSSSAAAKVLGELMNSLKLFPFMNKGRLTGTDDLNNVLTSGIYEISAPTTGVLNGKDIQYGILIVFSAGQRIQLLGNGLYGNAYFRTGRDNGRWYDWVSIY